MKEFRGRGYAQKAIQLAEEIHGSSRWELDTILQEKGNCHLYEKMGYYQTGETRVINERMTLIFYKKDQIIQIYEVGCPRVFKGTTDFSFMRFAPVLPATLDEPR